MPEEARTAAAVKSSCETPDLAAGIQLKFSEDQQVLLATEPPLQPTVGTCVYVKIITHVCVMFMLVTWKLPPGPCAHFN